MKPIIRWFLYLLTFWLLVFLVGRVTFYLCTVPLLKGVNIGLVMQSLYKGFRLDLSMFGYFLALPIVLLTGFLATGKRAFLFIIDLINYLLISIYVLTFVGESSVYREWRAKLTVQALEHFSNPDEVFKTASTGLTILFFGLSAIFIFLFLKIYNKYASAQKLNSIHDHSLLTRLWKTPVFLLSGAFLAIVLIRGGLQAIPIQSSDSFFSTTPIVNDVAVNPFWNIAYNILDYQNRFKKNPFNDFQMDEANNYVRSLFQVQKDTTINFLTNDRPNIVFILAESWNTHSIKSFGGDDFAPFINSLSRQGIRFTNFYSSGYVSDQGIPSVLSGYPSVSRVSVINQNSKSAKLPCINQDLKKYGYQSGFLFGGDLNYGNIKGYVLNKAFDIMKEEKDIDPKYARGKLGIQDNDMINVLLENLNAAQTPFVFAWFTLSTHMPYDFEGAKRNLVNHKENDYINSIVFSDHALREFFEKAKNTNWYKNTLFVFVADHSHADHKDFGVYDAEYHHIPLIFFGDVIKPEFRGKEIRDVFSQLDITPTLLKQMGLNTEAGQYVWGRNMFNPYSRHFAYFSTFAGGGVVSDEGKIGYQHGLDKLIINSFGPGNPKSTELKRLGKAFQQTVFEDYRLK